MIKLFNKKERRHFLKIFSWRLTKIFTFENASELLANYKKLRRAYDQLQYELEHYNNVTENEMIETMTFDGERLATVKSTNVANRTLSIALTYSNNVESINLKAKEELQNELDKILVEMKRIAYYIKILGNPQSRILSLIYLEEKTFIETAEILELSLSSIKKYRIKAIKELVEMFNRITQ